MRRLVIIPLLFCAFVVLIFAVVTAALHSPLVVNALLSSAEAITGYRVRVDDISFSPLLNGTVSGLDVLQRNGDRLRVRVSRGSVRGTVSPSFEGEIEMLELSEPSISFQWETEKPTDLSFLDKLPPVRRLIIRKGSVEITFPRSQQVIRLTDVDAELGSFSSRKGGTISLSGNVEFSSPAADGLNGRGRCSAKLALTAILPQLLGKGDFDVRIDAASRGGLSLQSAGLAASFDFGTKTIQVKEGKARIGSLMLTGEGRDVRIEDLIAGTSMRYDRKSKAFSAPLKAQAPAFGTVEGVLGGTAGDPFSWKTTLKAPSLDIAGVLAILRPLLPPSYSQWSAQGKGAVDIEAEGRYSDGRLTWSGTVEIGLTEGGFSSPDGSRAGQGLTGRMKMRLQSPQGTGQEKRVSFDVTTDVTPAEILWGTYYNRFSEVLRISSRGDFTYQPDYAAVIKGSMDLFGTGTLLFSGSVQGDRLSVDVQGDHLPHQPLYDTFLAQYVRERAVLLEGTVMTGHSSVSVKVSGEEGRFTLTGSVRIDDASLSIPGLSLSVENLNLTLPYDLSYPDAGTAVETPQAEPGRLRVASFAKDDVVLKDLDMPIVISRNSVSLPERLSLPLYGGVLQVEGLKAERILSADRSLTTQVTLASLDLGSMTQSLTGITIPGRLDASLRNILYREGRWTSEGSAGASLFDGVVEATGIHAERLFDESRRLGADLVFRGINLEKMTEIVKIGKITGVIQGAMKNLVVEYGQLARFILDIDSAESEGIKQTISIDAVNNISILGSGSAGISMFGLNRFFREFPYSRLGIHCTLENDTFTLRGKIREGGKEYLVRKTFFMGIDIINQNPDNTISFRDMQERLSRITSEQKEKDS
ncbi:MAG TPA: hypothetical protein VN260_01480 [Dissulfurispiraceae bacterium]|nr:hypothetical protein [Dissulfurispiraceae bacterium]